MANTAAWTATSTPLPRTSATARTTAVIHAEKRGPRTSTRRSAEVIAETFGRRTGRVWSVGTGLRRSDRGSCRRGTGRLCVATSAGCPRRESSRSRGRSDMGVYQCGQLVRSRRAAAAADQLPVTSQVEQRRGAADVEVAHLLEVALGVDVDHGQARPSPPQVLQPRLRRPAGPAEGGREL